MFRENLAFLLEMTVTLSVLAFMSQLRLTNQVFQGKPILVTLLIIYCLSNAIKIIKDFRSQRRSHAWIATISGLVILLLITGHVEAVRPLAFVMCIVGGCILDRNPSRSTGKNSPGDFNVGHDWTTIYTILWDLVNNLSGKLNPLRNFL